MRILFIHNQYLQPGGEDTAFENEFTLLKDTDEVSTLIFKNPSGLSGAFCFLLSIWNIFSARKIVKAIREFEPDVVHMHNWHFVIGPLAIRAVHKRNIPIVLTIPNFRLLCPSATLLHKGDLFLDSVHSCFPWEAIRKKVYRDSFLQTFWLAFIIWFHRKIGTWQMVDKYILLTDFAKKIFVSSLFGVDKSKFAVKPNFIKLPVVKEIEREDFFLFVGRLSEEKGIEVLLDSFRNKRSILYIAGDGPFKEQVISACNDNPNIHYLGLLNEVDVEHMMRRCSALIFPSIWYEGMPLTLIEAFAVGTPIIASDLGAMSSMITAYYNGIHFTPGSMSELSEKIAYWEQLDDEDKMVFSQNASKTYKELYSPAKNKEQLRFIYNSILKNKNVDFTPFNKVLTL